RSHYLTVSHGPLRLVFKAPIQTYSYGPSGHLKRHVLSSPQSLITLPRTAAAGTVFVAATPRTWEKSRQAAVSWFPAGGAATAVASPAPGATIKSDTPITLTFSKTVHKAIGSHMPPVSPNTAGTWHQVNAHAIQFRPEGYGNPRARRQVRLALCRHALRAAWLLAAGLARRGHQGGSDGVRERPWPDR